MVLTRRARAAGRCGLSEFVPDATPDITDRCFAGQNVASVVSAPRVLQLHHNSRSRNGTLKAPAISTEPTIANGLCFVTVEYQQGQNTEPRHCGCGCVPNVGKLSILKSVDSTVEETRSRCSQTVNKIFQSSRGVPFFSTVWEHKVICSDRLAISECA